MRATFLVFLSLFLYSSHAQTLKDAEVCFTKFEYKQAYTIYKSLYGAVNFSNDDLKRFAYSDYIIGEYQTCYELSPKILALKNIEPYFTFIYAESCMHLGKYDEAKAGFLKYHTLDKEKDISILLLACNQIPTWQPMQFVSNYGFKNNTHKADITGAQTKNEIIEFHETGIDSAGNPTEEIHHGSELILIKPYFKDLSGNIHTLNLDPIYNFASIASLSLHPSSDLVLISIAEPVSDNKMKIAPHIYAGNWSQSEHAIKNLTPWAWSGFEDSTSCAHVTFNASGNTVAFTKQKNGSSDIYISKLEGGNWSKPASLADINTALNEMYPVFHGDTVLSFSSDGRVGYGNLDIYNYRFSDRRIEHVKAPINSAMDNFNLLYYNKDSAEYTSNNFNGVGDDDRYFIKFREKPVKKVNTDSLNEVALSEKLKQIEQAIYFDYKKSDLKSGVSIKPELIQLFNDDARFFIRLEAHADNRGGDSYNVGLSNERAITIRKELIRLGIKAEKISAEAKGETSPFVKCGDCTEEMHGKNRVVVITLFKK
ncbi:MAG TPA: OmpA family protein [Flavobacteriales bacterium]|nr:OmpA family protein [Flavobacteriales bacterium]